MERLLKDAQELTGVEYNIDNLDDVFMAVHAIQEEIGITGTTALEAEETIQGSFNAMKAAFSNVLGALAIGEGLSGALSGLATTVSTFLFDNLIPMIGTIITALPGAITTFLQEVTPAFLENGAQLIRTLADGLVTGIPAFFETMAEFMSNVVTWIQEQLPTILKKGVEFITNFATGIFDGAPGVIDNIGEILNNVLTAIFEALPLILESGMEIISNLAKGIWDNLPKIVESIGNVLGKLIDTIVEKYPEYFKKGWEIIGEMAAGIWNNLPEIISTMVDLIGSLIRKIGSHLPDFLAKGIELVAKMAVGLVQAIPGIVAKVPQLIGAIVKGIASLIGDFVTVGADIVKGLWKGINSVKDWILGKISGFVSSITSGIKSFFGISSPSKVMADEVGKWLPIGLADGIEGNIKPVTDAMNKLGELTTGTLESKIRVSSIGDMNVQGLNNNNGITQHLTINSPKELSPSETARQVKNASRNLAMEW